MIRLVKSGVVALLALSVLLGNTALVQAGVASLLDDCVHCKCGGKSTCCIKKAEDSSTEQTPAAPAPAFRLNQPMSIATAWLWTPADRAGAPRTLAAFCFSPKTASKVPIFLRHRSILI